MKKYLAFKVLRKPALSQRNIEMLQYRNIAVVISLAFCGGVKSRL